MRVETTGGALGEHDLSKPRVVEVDRDPQGHVRDLVVEKGAVFRKKVDVPADRVEEVAPEMAAKPGAPPAQRDNSAANNHANHANHANPANRARGRGADAGTVVIDAGEQEVDALSAVGSESLVSEHELDTGHSLLDELEERLPTDEGLREQEHRNALARAQQGAEAPVRAATRAAAERSRQRETTGDDHGGNKDNAEKPKQKPPHGIRGLLQTLGPGLLGGMSGNDPSAVTSYAIAGASTGYAQLWLMVIATPLWQATLAASGTIGRITQRGLTDLVRTHYGRWLALFVTILLVVGNVALIGADLVAVGSGFELITGVSWVWFVAPVAAVIWYITVFQNFDSFKKVFLVLSFAFLAYVITAFITHANAGAVLRGTFVPSAPLSLAGISSVVSLLGATISPYTIFWQAQGEKEEQRAGPRWRQVRTAKWDIFSGVLGGNMVSYCIILVTSATLYVHNKQIQTAADAARSLEPLLGPGAKYLFAIGFIGAGFVAIPVLLASTAYVVTGAFGWAGSLWRKPWQNEGFYLTLSVALVVSLGLALLRVSPIQLMFGANILQAFLAPALLVLLLVIGNTRRIMGEFKLRWLTNLGLALTLLILVAALALLVIGWVTGLA